VLLCAQIAADVLTVPGEPGKSIRVRDFYLYSGSEAIVYLYFGASLGDPKARMFFMGLGVVGTALTKPTDRADDLYTGDVGQSLNLLCADALANSFVTYEYI
jgi:hypothetical protein